MGMGFGVCGLGFGVWGSIEWEVLVRDVDEAFMRSRGGRREALAGGSGEAFGGEGGGVMERCCVCEVEVG